MDGWTYDLLKGIDRKLDQLLALSGAIQAQGESIMAATQDLKQVIGELKDETDKVAVRLDKAIKQLESGVGPDDTATAIADLKVIRDHMHDMGTDPANPVPPLPPAPPVEPNPPQAAPKAPKK